MTNEKRLIDANACLHDMCKRCNIENEGCPCEPADCFIYNVLENSTTVDAVEVVRCEKCRYYFDGACANYKNRVATRLPDFGDNYKYVEELKVAKDHFCSYGERKTDG